MGRSTIPVDLFNPGQVFGCLGLAEAAEVLFGRTRAGFTWSGDEAHFTVSADHDAPVASVLEFLGSADLVALSPSGTELTAGWGVLTETLNHEEGFPYAPPSSPAALPVALRKGEREIVFDHWADTTRRDNVKFWAGAQGKPGASRLHDALALVRDRLGDATKDPFACSAPQGSAFRLDWRRDYVPLGIGFSLNHHKSTMSALGYPLVEILAAIGLTHARPMRPDPRNKLLYRYAVARGDALPLTLLRPVLGVASLPLPTRVFRITLSWPAKVGQARCITDVHEETADDHR